MHKMDAKYESIAHIARTKYQQGVRVLAFLAYEFFETYVNNIILNSNTKICYLQNIL